MEHHRGGGRGGGDHEGRGGRGGGRGGGHGGPHEGREEDNHEGRGGRGGAQHGGGGGGGHIQIVAIVSPKPGKEQRVEEALKNISQKVFDNEPDCLRYRVHKEEGGNDIIVIETYRNQEAVDKHMSSPDFHHLGEMAKNEDLLSKPFRIIKMSAVHDGGFSSRRKGFNSDDD